MTPETDKRYVLTDLRTGDVRRMDVAEAAEIMELNADEIAWCIEHYGVCENDRYRLTEI